MTTNQQQCQQHTADANEADVIKLISSLHDLFKDATGAAVREKPRDLVDFLANYFTRMRDEAINNPCPAAASERQQQSSPPYRRISSSTSPGLPPPAAAAATKPAKPSIPFYVVVDDDEAVEPDRQHFLPKKIKVGIRVIRKTHILCKPLQGLGFATATGTHIDKLVCARAIFVS